jgi:ribosomal protein S26
MHTRAHNFKHTHANTHTQYPLPTVYYKSVVIVSVHIPTQWVIVISHKEKKYAHARTLYPLPTVYLKPAVTVSVHIPTQWVMVNSHKEQTYAHTRTYFN